MIRTGIGYDVHRIEAGRPLVLGGVRIEHSHGLAGHSDADVICHAVADAVLGALARGDIGGHFPDTDPANKDLDSLRILEHCRDLARGAGATIHNVDVTLIAEAPRIAPHLTGMREAMARALGVSPGQVGVKATTHEGLGTLGRGEGMAAMATACLDLPATPPN